MRRHLWLPALISLGVWGCGGGEEVKPGQQAGGAAGGAPAAGGAAPQMGAGGAMPAGMGGGGAPAAAATASASAQDLLNFVPEDLKIAAGANIATLSDSTTPFGAQ